MPPSCVKIYTIYSVGRSQSDPGILPSTRAVETATRSSTVRRRNPTPATRSRGGIHRLSDLNSNAARDNEEYFGGDSTVFMSKDNDKR